MSSVARLVGYGYDRPSGDDEMPLDVHYAKVTEWLVDRKLLPHDWARKLQIVQATAAEASKSLPSGLLAEITGSSDASVDYLAAKEILTRLAKTADKSLLGSLKGEAGTWERIVKAYESNMLHVAEAGLALARNVDYEVPFFKKQASKNQQLISDSDRRIADLLKSASAAEAGFRQECESLGISERAASSGGQQLLRAIHAMSNDLPKIMDGAVNKIKIREIDDAMAYYFAFTKYAAGTECGEDSLHTLREVYEGNTAPPSSDASGSVDTSESYMLESMMQNLQNPMVGVSNETSGTDGGGANGDSKIVSLDWNVDVTAAGREEPSISWENNAEASGDNSIEILSNEDNQGVEVCWDIEIDESGAAEPLSAENVKLDAIEESDIVKSKRAELGDPSEEQGGMEVPTESRRLAADSSYRTLLLDDLYELLSFLKQRSSELQAGGQDVSHLIAQDVANAENKAQIDKLAEVDVSSISKMATSVESVLKVFNDERTVMLGSLLSNQSHRQRLAKRLTRQAGQAEKFRSAAASVRQRKMQSQQQLMADSAKLSLILRRTDALKGCVEEILGSRLGRRINVQGEINNVLSQNLDRSRD